MLNLFKENSTIAFGSIRLNIYPHRINYRYRDYSFSRYSDCGFYLGELSTSDFASMGLLLLTSIKQ
jgi:hypothetical protein